METCRGEDGQGRSIEAEGKGHIFRVQKGQENTLQDKDGFRVHLTGFF